MGLRGAGVAVLGVWPGGGGGGVDVEHPDLRPARVGGWIGLPLTVSAVGRVRVGVPGAEGDGGKDVVDRGAPGGGGAGGGDEHAGEGDAPGVVDGQAPGEVVAGGAVGISGEDQAFDAGAEFGGELQGCGEV